MSEELNFRLVTLGLLLCVGAIGGYFRHRAEREGGKLESTQGQGLVIYLRLLALVALIPLLLYVINPAWVAWARMLLPDWVRWAAADVALVMLPLIYWLYAAIGNNISPTQATREGHQLVTSGPYRYIRHPLYTFAGIYFMAIAFVSALWWVAVWLLVALAILVWRTGQEEANLIARFGDQYRDYMAHTGRFFPRLSSR
jgi:protein-S-isoprenylcysteine O-methyltransferase Ste14